MSESNASLQTKASRKSASEEDRKALQDGIDELRPVLDQLEALETELAPYEQIKAELIRNRQRYRELISYFVTELRYRCNGHSDD